MGDGLKKTEIAIAKIHFFNREGYYDYDDNAISSVTSNINHNFEPVSKEDLEALTKFIAHFNNLHNEEKYILIEKANVSETLAGETFKDFILKVKKELARIEEAKKQREKQLRESRQKQALAKKMRDLRTLEKLKKQYEKPEAK